MTPEPITSIIIAARDAERTLARTLDSLLAQTDPRWEARTVDDGSVDGTLAIITDYARRDPRFVVLKSAGIGASGARNVSLSGARGERILFLDSDDWIDRHFLIKMNAALDDNPSAVAAYCDYCRVMPDGSETPTYSAPGIEKEPFETFARTCATVIHGVLVKKSVVLKVGGFDTDLRTCEEWDLWQRIARGGGNWIHVNERLSYYRASDHSLTLDLRQMLADAHIVIERGFSNDPRVAGPAPAYRAGASPADGSTSATAYAYFALWCAGIECGRGTTSDTVQEVLGDIPKTEASVNGIVHTLINSIVVGIRASPGKLAERWHHYGIATTRLIEAVGHAWNDPAAARTIQYKFERMVLDYDDLAATRALSLTLGLRVNLRRIRALRPANNIDRLYVYLCDGPHILALLDIGVLGEIDSDFWMRLITEHLDFLRLEERASKLVRLRIKIYRLTKFLRRWRSHSNNHRNRLHALQTMMSCQVTAPPVSNPSASDGSRGRGAEKPRGMPRDIFWEEIFEEEDPWNYGSPYEQEKYHRQLEMLPAEPVERALELGCAEGHFTSRLAPKVKHLLACDISKKAMERARTRCKEHRNVEFVQHDLSVDALPEALDLIICSEVLYYLSDEKELESIATRLAEALRPGGHLITAHAFVLKDNMSRTGFDWENPYGAETIARVMGNVAGLALETSIQTELYRVDRYRRLHVEEVAPEPQLTMAPLDAPIETEVARFILWNGAVARRSDLARSEKRSRVPILMYHRIASDGPKELARYRLPPDTFQEQMLWLRRNGYHTINSEQLAWFVANNHPFFGRPVLITFDDGYEDFADLAWPILRANDFSAEVFIVTDIVGMRAEWDVSFGVPAPLMSAAKIVELAAEGVSFGSHMASHTLCDKLSTRELAEELTRSRAQLENWLKRPVTSIAAPFGCTDQRFRILASECGFKVGFNTANGAASLKDDPLNLPRIEVRGDCTLDVFANCMEACR
jgi:peptidoglycan/xylan/chitin deacetylase (PgdA/CDA1 family)/glycosyltransferase involved in cell wall biosynthesis